MFKTSRPRVPSKAALRVLYQLAYISSGTAVGVATLCAEERRRRTQIVQKIADNARRIRQSPRCVHSAGTSVAVDAGGDDHVEHWELNNLQTPVRRSKRKRTEDLEWSARAADLPSKVEAGYEQLQKQEGQRSNGSIMPAGEESLAARANPAEKTGPGVHASRSQGSLTFSAPAHMGPWNDAAKKRVTNTTSGENLSFDLPSICTNDQSTMSFKSVTSRNQYQDAVPSTESTSADLQTDGQLICEVSADLERFFRACSLFPQQRDILIADSSRLLQVALETGSFAEVKLLCLWKMKVGALSNHDIRRICEACRIFALRADHQELFDFYEGLFATPRFLQIPGESKVYCTLILSTESIWRDAYQDAPTQRQRIRQGLCHGTPQEIEMALSSVCYKLSKDGRPGDADIILKTVQRYFQKQKLKSNLFHIEDSIFFSALNVGQWRCCFSILKRTRRFRSSDDDELISMVQPLLAKALKRRQYEPIASVLERLHVRLFLKRICDRLTVSEKIFLAIAYTKTKMRHDRSDLWETLYTSIPESHREAVVKARTTGQLWEMWNATRNLDLIRPLSEDALDWAQNNRPQDRRLKLEIRLTMVEILNRAGKPTQALDLLHNISENHAQSSLSLSDFAVTLATKGSWEEVHRIMDVLGRWDKFTVNDSVTRALNTLLHLYSVRHTADEVWSFVTGLIAKLRFEPTWATTAIMLDCFVGKQAVHMILKWLCLVKAMGHSHFINWKVAENLLMRYYREHRPPYNFVLWFIRMLTENASSLKPSKFSNLTKESVAYDLRHCWGERRWKARDALAKLEKGADLIPQSRDEARRLQERRQMPKGDRSLFVDNASVGSGTAFVADQSSEDDVDASLVDDVYPGDDAANFAEKSSEHHANTVSVGSKSKGDNTTLVTKRNLADSIETPFVSDACEGAYTAHSAINPSQDGVYTSFVGGASHNRDTAPSGNESTEVDMQSPGIPLTAEIQNKSYEAALRRDAIPPAQRSARSTEHDIWRRMEYSLFQGSEQRSNDMTIERDAGEEDVIDHITSVENGYYPFEAINKRDSKSELREEHMSLAAINESEETHLDEQQADLESELQDGGPTVHERAGTRQLERDMILAVSAEQYEKALKLYGQSLDSSGLPPSRMVLEVAVDASLRLRKGDRLEAEGIVTKAQEAGMNVSGAIGKLLRQRIWSFTPVEKRNFEILRTEVVEYYRMAEESGLPVDHHFGLTAANILINNHRPAHGLSLLNSILKSPWASDQPLTIVAMTIYLKGFAAVESLPGIRWVVETVMKENMPIDKFFLDALKSSCKNFGQGRTRTVDATHASRVVDRLRYWYRICRGRNFEQRQQSRELGLELVRVLGTAVNAHAETRMMSPLRKTVESALLGKPEARTPIDATAEELKAAQRMASEDVIGAEDLVARMRSTLYIPPLQPRQNEVPRPIDDEHWLNQYRVVLKQALIIDDRPASFRYQLDIDMGCPFYELPFQEVDPQAQTTLAHMEPPANEIRITRFTLEAKWKHKINRQRYRVSR